MVSVQYLKYFMKICQTRSMNKEAEGEKLLKHTRLILGQFALLENLHEDENYNQLSVSAFPCLIPSNVLISYKKDAEYGKSLVDYQKCRVGQIIENVHNSISEMGMELEYNYGHKRNHSS